ncbi:nicotinamide phosphoribosyltransferase [Asticcacaulis biprosthecium C19]|uniref:Nicotinamide phosphoribosyltransferase n=1 Tax=Asticcacaulis biprosthecium C19 TaxID=715226 RepID=F4QGX5_9CAUL|nr:nicotinate phosphoribosyltransferase [Asticcacaulis biprosthecium]EGF93728.1 nicotinamide phosphoribosyltransferase [Asticcacaulis biprosthecium C19]
MTNPILNTDSYKASHYLQYPQGTQQVFSYVEARGGPYPEALFFGLQAILKTEFANPVTSADIEEARDLLPAHGLPFHEAGWQLLLDRHDGRLPLDIRAQPEGTVAPIHVPMMTVVNTDPDFFWLTSYVETALLRVWYPITVATISHGVRRIIRDALVKTADDPDGELPFKLHDFGARGVSSAQSAALGGLAHLVNFQGTDTLAAILAARKFYHEPMAGFSIPAAEHSTITSWERPNEQAAYANMVQQFGKPGGLYAVVSDSYDLYHAVDHIWGEALRQKVIDSGATLVVRPDSGDPVEVVSKTLHLLANRFGTDTNTKGFRVLKNVRVIQGDGVNPVSIAAILDRITAEGFSASNLAFGMGGALLQKCDRDTLQFAYKASAAKVNGVWRDVYKDPVTDTGKRSKRGLLGLTTDLKTTAVRDSDWQPVDGGENLLHPVWRNGELLRDEPLSAIRARAAAGD